MNIQALNHYIAEQLCSFVRIYRNHTLSDIISMRTDFSDTEFYRQNIEQNLIPISAVSMPVFMSVNGHIIYGKVALKDRDYIVGPVYSNENLDFRYHVSVSECPNEFLHKVPVCLLSFMINQLLLLHNLYSKKEVKFWDCLTENCLNVPTENSIQEKTSELLFHNLEYGDHHNPYEQEKRELFSIENGDLIQLKNSWDEQYTGSFGLTSTNPIRNGKNLGIIVVSLATRAAIRGGILPEIALSLGDNYMLQIDGTQNPYEIGPLVKKAEYTLAEMVKEKKTGHTPPTAANDNITVSRCKDYIFKHLHEKITVKEVAAALYMNPNYLSALFKKKEGIPLYQYIVNEKISLVKNMLIYSQYSFSQITAYLGFSSQSHLGKVFKRATGYTLNNYRNTFSKSEFLP